MKTFIASAKVGKDQKINVPKKVMDMLEVTADEIDVLVFIKMDCGIVVTTVELP